MQKYLLLIFARTPEYGKVKKRLAIELGNAKALAIHQRLLGHTLEMANKSGIAYKVYLSVREPINYGGFLMYFYLCFIIIYLVAHLGIEPNFF